MGQDIDPFSARAISRISVIGGGSAGFMAALALKVKLPDIAVRVIRSKEIPIIGVGEGSTVALTNFLHGYLQISRQRLQELAQPTWKIGLKFIWGSRPYFNYSFGPGLETRTDRRQEKPNGYYCAHDIEYTDLVSALMTEDRVFATNQNRIVEHPHISYHVENHKFVGFLETAARAAGIQIVEDTVDNIVPGPAGIEKLEMKSGQVETADLFVDCSGFASILLGGKLGEPFIDYKKSLFCSRAIVGGWTRADSTNAADKIIKPYTTCETMDAGWAWQIELEERINRGYVYSPEFTSDEQAEAEFRAKNPQLGPTRRVDFKSGRFARAWVGNVVAVGNSSGFVEPLEATALGVIASQAMNLTEVIRNSDRQPRPMQVAAFNRIHGLSWDSIRDFLAVHYRFNGRLNTPFWEHCRQNTDLAGAEPIVEYYKEMGPDGFYAFPLLPNPQDTVGGYLTMLVGMKVPYRQTWKPSVQESARYDALRKSVREAARAGVTVRQALDAMRASFARAPQPARQPAMVNT